MTTRHWRPGEYRCCVFSICVKDNGTNRNKTSRILSASSRLIPSTLQKGVTLQALWCLLQLHCNVANCSYLFTAIGHEYHFKISIALGIWTLDLVPALGECILKLKLHRFSVGLEGIQFNVHIEQRQRSKEKFAFAFAYSKWTFKKHRDQFHMESRKFYWRIKQPKPMIIARHRNSH